MVNFTILAAGYSTLFSRFVFVPPEADSTSTRGQLLLTDTFPAGNNASWIQRSPVDPNVLYAVNENVPTGSLLSFTLTDTGIPTKVDEISSEGADPPFVGAFGDGGKEALIVNYNGGNARFVPTVEGSLTMFVPPGRTQLMTFPPPAGGVSHPHFFNTLGDELFIADLGADQIWRISKAANGTFVITGSIPQPHLSGPRRFVTLPSPLDPNENFVYTLHELENSFTVQRVPEAKDSGVGGADGGIVPVLDTVIVSPPGVNPNDSAGGVYHAAELLWAETTSPLETLFYVSNRNTANTSPNGDSIVIISATFDLSSTSNRTGPTLTKVASHDTGLDQIRGMELSPDASGRRYLAAAGQFGGGVKVFERVDGGRQLVEVASFGREGEIVEQPVGARNVTTFIWV